MLEGLKQYRWLGPKQFDYYDPTNQERYLISPGETILLNDHQADQFKGLVQILGEEETPVDSNPEGDSDEVETEGETEGETETVLEEPVPSVKSKRR